ncbi:MAG: hypothetical protein Q9170_006696 [Blastenia crenularia]
MPLGYHRRRPSFYPPPPRRFRHGNNCPARSPIPKPDAVVPSKLSWLDGKGVPGPTAEDFKNLQSTTISSKDRTLGLSVEEAFTLAERQLKSHVRRQIACIHQCPGPMTLAQKQKLPFQVFNELDKEYFRSVLNGNVSLGWSYLPNNMFSRTVRAGRNNNPRIRIELSPALYQGPLRCDILAALIHQMVHAYYLQCCGYRDRGFSGEGHDLGHEQSFQALLECVGEHCEPLRGCISTDLWAPPLHTRSRFQHQPNSGTVSSCYTRGSLFNSIDIKNWRNDAVAKCKSRQEAQHSKSAENDRSFPHDVYFVNKDGIEDLPKRLESWQYPREAYVFLSFDNRCYPVLRRSVKDLAALASSPYFKDRCWLQLPQGTSEANFLTLYFFLVWSKYAPSLKNLNGSSTTLDTSGRGPPKIQPYDAGSPTPVVSLIAAFEFGKLLQYAPFCNFIMDGLRSLSASAENPIAVLERIYGNRRPEDKSAASTPFEFPDPQLRDWARSWLTVKLSDANIIQLGARYRTNLDLVRFHPDWSVRHEGLKKSSPKLMEDEMIVESNISNQGSGDGSIPRAIPVGQTPTLLDLPQTLSMQRPFEYPRGASPIPSWQTEIPNRIPQFPRTTNNDIFNLSELLRVLPQEHVQNLVEKLRTSSGDGSRPASLQESEVSRWMQEQSLRDRQVAQGSDNMYGDIYRQALQALGIK